MLSSIWRTTSLALVLTIGAAGSAGAASIDLISKANPVPDTFWDSASPSVSEDGRYVLFWSFASNLMPGQIDGNNNADLFLHDRTTGTTTLVSHQAGSPTTADPRGAFFEAALSADGRYAVYSGPGTHLVAGTTDTNNGDDVFLWDRVTGTTTLVSHAAGAPNVAADGLSGRARISADGEWVVFTSHAKNLVPGQIEPTVLPGSATTTEDVFLWQRSTGTVTLVSHKSGAPAAAGNRGSSQPRISADGSFIVFESEATDLLAGPPDANNSIDVFVYQRTSGTLSLVTRRIGTGTGLGHSWESRISADGRFIAFASLANNLVAGQVDIPNTPDAFLFDRVTGEMRLASHTSASPVTAAGILQHLGLALSADGSVLAFVSEANNLVPGQVDTNGKSDVFVYDRLSGGIELASHAPGLPATAAGGPAQAAWPSLSADGRFVVFTSDAQDLVSGEPDAPEADDVFLYDRGDRSVVLVTHGSVSNARDGSGLSTLPIISQDGSVIALTSTMAGLGEAYDPNGFLDVFVYSRSSAEIAVVSRRDPANLAAVTPHGPSYLGDISADGRTILFQSLAAGLVPGQIDVPYGFYSDGFGFPDGTSDAFLYDRSTGKTVLLSRSPSSPLEAIGLASQSVLSADGRFAAFAIFVSSEPPLIPGTFLQLYDKTTDTAILVNHKPGAPAEPAPGHLSQLAISTDGRYLAFVCNGCRDLVPGYQSGNPANSQADIFLYDRVTDTHTLVSHASGSPVTGGNTSSYFPVISADGRFVAFASGSTNFIAGLSDLPDSQDIFVFDRTTGGLTLVSRSASSAALTANQLSRSPVISADGRFIAFLSAATNLVPGQADTNDGTDVFVWDRIAGTTSLVTHANSLPTTAAHVDPSFSFLSSASSFSADGRFLVYESPATNLAGIDTNGGLDVFLYDLATKSNTLVSHALGEPGNAGNKKSGNARISADGRRIAFVSPATNLVAGQAPNGPANLILQDRITGARTLVGPVSPLPSTSNSSFLSLGMSADGRSVAFTSESPVLVAGDLNNEWDVFLYREGSNGPVTVPACTLFDTRRPEDGPALRSGVREVLAVHGACGVPADATAVLVKVTVPEPRRRGSLRLTPGDAATPASTLRFPRRQTRTGTFTVPLAADGTLALQPIVAGNGTVHAVVEVIGYVE